ncbi:methyltransferase [Candidatus Nanopelagicus abundans]|uniref:Methyltransferase n=1 Tax=Candidatus Nanopelagicus abundans TaxID=1884916 RepID=A0A249L4S5_9ACTN|nr:SAM-dependent methyltransferase [Candidatus Nanopelagicus abundans]ASY24098.1 methyltransferase [Candidatus Nanopelagicus abundans]
MKIELGVAVAQLDQRIKSEHFVRAVLSGRRRNMQTEFERIDIKPVLIKEEIKWQIISSDGKKDITKNVEIDFNFTHLFSSGFANLVVDTQTESYQVRISKKDEALVSVSKVNLSRDLSHDRQKQRMLAESNQVFKALDMSDLLGRIKPSKMDKYKQVDEFLRLISQTLDTQDLKQDEISVVDLGCGHAYLTFAVGEFLKNRYKKVSILGVDERDESKEHNEKVALKLKVEAKFIAAKISDTPNQVVDIAIALHACDTATDDAIYWAVKNNAQVIMAAPCCMHELQTQIKEAPEPWALLTKNGLVKERLVDLITDSLRAQILKLLGYRVDIVEFIGGEHTARNILIRAVKTNQISSDIDKDRYQQMLSQWQIKPYLAKLLASELKASAGV